MEQNLKQFIDFAFRLLAKRDYFTEELKNKILQKGAAPEEADEIIEYISKFNYLNDIKVMESFVSEIKAKGKGTNYLRQKLYEKGCSSLLSSTDLSAFYPQEEEIEIAEKALMKIRCDEPEKLVSKLISRGFSPAAAISAAKRFPKKQLL